MVTRKYRSSRHSCMYFGSAGERLLEWEQGNTEVVASFAYTSVMSELECLVGSKEIPK